MAKKHKQPTELVYYLTIYTLEGHTTYRAHLSRWKGAFDKESKMPNFPKITSKTVMIIDRLTGGFKQPE